MSLQKEIDKRRAEIRTDGYAVSIGEWMSMYARNELDIHPDFQRYYRWSPAHKTRLIESILLGIPIPPIFVAQRTDGIWDVIDGVQRLSTIFEFAGILRDDANMVLPPLTLEGTEDLPSLRDKRWEARNQSDSFTPVQRLLIKRAKLDVSIVLAESDPKSKYELFMRLNTGGCLLSRQEVRNCLLSMLNNDMLKWLIQLARSEHFQTCTSLTDKALEEQYDVELALRFIVFRTLSKKELSSVGDMHDFLDARLREMAMIAKFPYEREADAFYATFDLLYRYLKENSFRRYDAEAGNFTGGFLTTAYEVIAMGVGAHYQTLTNKKVDVAKIVKHFWVSEKDTLSITGALKSGSGVRASSRIPTTIPVGRNLFKTRK